MSDQDEKHAAGETSSSMADISVPELLTLLRDQAIAATRREEDSARREERLTAMLDAIHTRAAVGAAGSTTLAGAAVAAAGSTTSAGQSAAGARRPPPDAIGQGPRLHEGVSLQEFGTWETRLRAHARRARWDMLSTEDQTASILALLDDYWTRTLQHGLDIPTPNTYSNIVTAFQQHLRRQRSVVLDRRDFFRRQQEAGESFDDYLITLKELAQFCDFCSQCRDEQFRDRIVNGVRDHEALQSMLAESDLTLDKAIKICRASESARKNSAALRPATVQPVSAYRRSRSLRRPSPAAERSWDRSSPAAERSRRRFSPAAERSWRRRSSSDSDGARGSRSPATRDSGAGRPRDWNERSRRGRQHRDAVRGDVTCDRCGRRRHCFSEICPARQACCYACGANGHFARMCPRADGRGQSSGGRSPTPPPGRRQSVRPVVADVRVGRVSDRQSPKIRAETRHSCGVSVMLWTPDTGAEVTCMGMTQAEQLGVDPRSLSAPTERFYAANGQELLCHGQFPCDLSLGDKQTSTTVFVLQGLDAALLAWFDAVHLGILPPDYPRQIGSVESADRGARSASLPALRRPAPTPPPPPSRATGATSSEEDVQLTAAAVLGRRESLRPPFGRATGMTSGDQAAQPTSTAASGSGVPPPPPLGGVPSQRSEPVRPADTRVNDRSGLPSWDSACGDPTQDQIREHMTALQSAFPRVFNSEPPLRQMSGGPMHIELTPDARPVAITAARNVPHAWRDEIKRQLDDLVSQGVIAAVDYPTDWCHPIVPVAKKPNPDGSDAGVRLCVDLTRLNRYVRPSAHPSTSPYDAVSGIEPGSRFFTTLDARSGYFQIPLAEADQDLTCFITPFGRYRFLRAPMGLCSSSSEYNRRGDLALTGIARTAKVVDDIIASDTSYTEHLHHVIRILERCDEHGITLHPLKMRYAASSVDYCGYRVSEAGFTVDERKTKAIREFPTPSNITDLRSFIGLANQLGPFSPEIAGAAEPLRDLLRPSRTWMWTTQHEEAFREVKRKLVAPPVLAFYDTSKPTALQTDASRLNGLGYALLQLHGSDWKLVQCGSRFLTSCETRYAVIELEMSAVTWAVKKCRPFLAGRRFEIITDHRPLVSILTHKSLPEIENPRLQRLRMKLLDYQFTTTWRPGRHLAIPDALSRAPVDTPTPDDEDDSAEIGPQIRCMLTRSLAETEPDGTRVSPVEDVMLTRLQDAASTDAEYQALCTVVQNGFPNEKADLASHLRPYWPVRDRLALEDGLLVCGPRLVIPSRLRREVLSRLHDSHQGIIRTQRRARQTVYWPGVDRDVANVVQSCASCRTYLPSRQREPLLSDPAPSRPFESVSTDFFSHAGHNYLVYVDRLSGWPIVASCPGDCTARTLIRHLRQIFASTGVPCILRSDNGPQYTARVTRDFLDRWGVIHRPSTPHYPQSNGHAEAAVKLVKRLLQKSAVAANLDSDDFARGLLEIRNTPRSDGRSPAQVLYGRPLRSAVVAHHRSFAPEWQRAADKCDARAEVVHAAAKNAYDRHSKPILSPALGSPVAVQHPDSRRWEQLGTVVGLGRRRDVLVKLPSGRVLWRNRRFVRPYPPAPACRSPLSESEADTSPQPNQPAVTTPSPPSSPPPSAVPRSVRFPAEPVTAVFEATRPRRQRHSPDRLQVDPSRVSYT